MTPQNYPKCSVIILNYYGEKIIENTLNSVLKLKYPKDKLEIIVVDNNSKDGSRQVLKAFEQKYKNIRLLFLDKNLGFAGGNNVGIKNAKGEFVALLNNDCVVDEEWLSHLIKTATSNLNVFAVSSKVLLYPKYLELGLKIDSRLAPIFCRITETNLYKFNPKKIYLNISEKDGHLTIEIPFDSVNDDSLEAEIVFRLKKEAPISDLNKMINFLSPNIKVTEYMRNGDEVVYKVLINLKKTSGKQTVNKIQNAGIIPFQDGYARDIGAIVRENAAYYEYDYGQYDKEVEVYAACGAAILMNKNMLEKIGYLDESFFMYYEDVEISERARLNDYKVYYSPKAIVRHIHAHSSGEGNNFFVYNVERGRMMHIFYNFPFRIFLSEYFKIIFSLMHGLIRALMELRNLKSISKDKTVRVPTIRRKLQSIKVLSYFLTHSVYLLYLRSIKIRKGDSVENNYQQILSGRWYFN